MIVDEFHHAAAPPTRELLDHLRARSSCSGLTATPNAATGCRSCTGSTIASPPSCGCGTRSTSSTSRRSSTSASTTASTCATSRGGVAAATTSTRSANVYTSSDAWARLVVQQVDEHADLGAMRALGFCVSIEHARFMADHFNRHGIAAVAIWGDSPRRERDGRASRDLAAGRVQVVFSVDLFNEGVDVPTSTRS